MKKRNFSVLTILMAGMLMAGVALAANVPNDQPDSSAYVGYGWNGYLPAFKGADGVSIPFIPVGIRPPFDYHGDFYADEFTDAKIKEAWEELKVKDPEAAKKILNGLGFVDGKLESRRIGKLDPKGVVNGNDPLKLTEIRRPAFFGQVPYCEEISKVEQDTCTVEFTVPRSYYERTHLKVTEPVKLRGWFIKGKGVPDARGKRTHAMIILYEGTSGQIFAFTHPDAPEFVYDFQTKQYKGVPYPTLNKNYQSEENWCRKNRYRAYAFNQAGFDVLIVDHRGNGYSGGFNFYDCDEMAEDCFRMLDQLESGVGLTILNPGGQLLQGKQTAGLLLRGMSAEQVPVIMGGFSQGAIVTSFVMQKNLVGWTAFNEPDQKFSPAKKYNIKAALLLDNFDGGPGYNNSLQTVYEGAALRVEMNIFGELPTSEILANIDKWPAVYFEHGLWDIYQSPEGTYEAYRRTKGLKKLVFIRGGHGGGASKHRITYMTKELTEFAVRAIVNPGKKYPELKSFKEAVLNSVPYWDSSSRP
jgi:hypothetical protein